MQDKIVTINTTFKLKYKEVVPLENILGHSYEMIDFRVMPNTEKLHKKDKNFQKLIKQKKAINKEISEYINNHNVE